MPGSHHPTPPPPALQREHECVDLQVLAALQPSVWGFFGAKLCGNRADAMRANMSSSLPLPSQLVRLPKHEPTRLASMAHLPLPPLEACSLPGWPW